MKLPNPNTELTEILKLIVEKDEEMDIIIEKVDSKLSEVDTVIEEVKQIKKGEDGESIQGEQGIQGERGEQGIQGEIGLSGKDGYTPIREIDYWTKEDREKITKDILKLIPKPKDGVSPKIEDIVSELQKKPVEYKDIQGAPDLTDLPKLVEFLKRGGFRGGGGSSGGTVNSIVAGSNITVDSTDPANPIVSSTGFSIPELTSDPATPTAESAWVLNTSSGGTGGGKLAFQFGGGMAITAPNTGGSSSYKFSYKTLSGNIKRVTLI